MKLLVSAYACAPDRGSEHAVGWNWATEAHRLGHQVWVLASSVHRSAIEAACRADAGLAGLQFVYPEVPFWPLRPGIEPKRERTYNLLWQRAALRLARDMHARLRFDAVHHLTWGGVRAPTFLGALGVPLIVGPLGGGETSPPGLRTALRLKARITETIRDLSNATIAFNPMLRGGLSAAALIVARTPETRDLLPEQMRRKTLVYGELSLPRAALDRPRGRRPQAPRLLSAGRLLYWKGTHIAIRAFAALAHQLPDARLTVVGSGPEGDRLKVDARALEVEDKIDFVAWLPQQQLFDLYRSHDLLLFPSLHDSGGTVIVEAMSRGMPVACLDLGGPRQLVTSDCGVVVQTAGRNTEQVAAAMAEELMDVFVEPDRLLALSRGAVARANEFVLSDRVAGFYEMAAARIGLPRGFASAGRQGAERSAGVLVEADSNV